MSLPKRDIPRPSNLPIAVDELYGIMRLRAFKSTGFPVNILAENDGTLRAQSILYHSGTTQIRQKAETDGSAIASLYGKNAGTLTALGLESTGEQRNVIFGKTSGAAITAQRVDAAGFQRLREFEPYEGTAVVPINTTATTIYTVPASTVAVVEVELTNTDTVANTIDFHIIASGGSASISNIILQDYSIPFATTPIRLGPYHLAAGAFLQALVTTGGGSNGDVNAIAIVKEYGTGDAVALV